MMTTKTMKTTGLARVLVLAALVVGTVGCPPMRDRDAERITFTVGGEVRPVAGGRVVFDVKKAKDVFNDLVPFFEGRDLVMVDFAGGVEFGCQALDRGQVYRWDPTWPQRLTEANIRVLNLADDHALDCGRDAMAKATSSMLAQNFYVTGAGREQREARAPVYVTQNQVTVSFASFLFESIPGIDSCDDCPGPALYHRDALIAALREMKKRSEHRVVVFHFRERELPTLTAEEMKVVREAIDYGADLVIGYGPATAGGVLRVRGHWVISSMGRLTGETSAASGKIADGFLLSAELLPSKIMNLRLAPVELVEGKSRMLRGEPGAKALARVLESSDNEVQNNATLIEDILYLK